MQEISREGLAKAIGVANFYPDRLVDLIAHNDVTPAVNQIETHPFFQRTADQALMREHGVQIESWGPFAEGKNNLFFDPTLSEIGAAHGKSVAQVRPPGPDAGEHRRLRLRAHRRRDDANRRHGHRHDAVLRPPRPRHGQLAQQPL
jgi:aryl-alcohol dehydrogenase-like predicted oxidoreductase